MSAATGEQKFRWVGTRPVRPDGHDKVTGRARYGADFSLPGMLCGRVLRSPHAHARILKIDTAEALALEGVHAVLTGDDLPDLTSSEESSSLSAASRNIMARDKVLYHGHAVAAVAASTPEVAREALALIRVEYEVLESVLGIEEALADGAPLLDEELRTKGEEDPKPSNVAAKVMFSNGDIEVGFALADEIVEREFTTQAVHQGYIEPHACLAQMGEDGKATLWVSSQGQFAIRSMTAGILGVELSHLRVIPAEIGGGFGGKTTVYLEPLAVALSRKSGRPVKMVMSREEVFRGSGPALGTRIKVKLGATREGRLVAAQALLHYEAGGFPGSSVQAGAMTIFSSYALEHLEITGYDVVVNKPKGAAYRAPGAPMAAFATESLMDELATRLEIDPVDFRLRNAAKEGVQSAFGPRFRRIGLVETLEAIQAHPHYRAPLKPNQGRGVAVGFWFNAGLQSSASVNVNEDGTVSVVSGSPDIGGSRASLAIMAAEELGIEYEAVDVTVADTASVGFNDVTGGSRVTFATGMAVIESAREVIQQLRERAASIWDVEVDQVVWQEGRAFVPDSKEIESLDLKAIADQAGETGGPITGRHSLSARGVGMGFGAHICDVQVDPETGRVEVVRYTAVQDAGRAIHPSYVEGQMQGGVAQGIGWALNEEYIYNADGELQNPGFLDYRIPVASDLPMIDTVIVEVPNDGHPYGVRGVGEVPIVAPLPAVANAVCAATGVRFTDLPLSPPRVLKGIEDAETVS